MSKTLFGDVEGPAWLVLDGGRFGLRLFGRLGKGAPLPRPLPTTLRRPAPPRPLPSPRPPPPPRWGAPEELLPAFAGGVGSAFRRPYSAQGSSRWGGGWE